MEGTGSKKTLGNLFDSYDEGKIHSQPGVRWDLFDELRREDVGREKGRERLVMDFFGNVQGVEVGVGVNETAWEEDLRRLGEILRRREEAQELEGTPRRTSTAPADVVVQGTGLERERREGAKKVEMGSRWGQQVMGAWALMGCALVWGGASWFESKK